MHIRVRWTGSYNFLMHQSSAFKLKFYRLWCTKCNLLLSRGPLSRTRFIPMAKRESESTYICMDKTRISEKTFFVPLGGYLLTIDGEHYPLQPLSLTLTFNISRFKVKWIFLGSLWDINLRVWHYGEHCPLSSLSLTLTFNIFFQFQGQNANFC